MKVEVIRKGAGKSFPAQELKKIARAVLELLEQGEVELSLALVGNAEIRKLNARFRSKDEPTDVLSFPSGARLPTGAQLLGDVVISIERAKRQAREQKVTLREEMVTLLIHGVVHLLGYDHERSAKDARIMGALEKKIRRRLCERGLLKV